MMLKQLWVVSFQGLCCGSPAGWWTYTLTTSWETWDGPERPVTRFPQVWSLLSNRQGWMRALIRAPCLRRGTLGVLIYHIHWNSICIRLTDCLRWNPLVHPLSVPLHFKALIRRRVLEFCSAGHWRLQCGIGPSERSLLYPFPAHMFILRLFLRTFQGCTVEKKTKNKNIFIS